MRTVIVLIILSLTGLLAGCSEPPALPTPTKPPPTELSTEMLMGYEVVDPLGKPIGPVDGLVVDVRSGETLYVVVLLEDIYHFGKGAVNGPQNQYLLIPWPHLRIATSQQLVVDVRADLLTHAPTLYQTPDTRTPAWDQPIRQYWAGY
jgi:hypothetical protein